MENITQILEHLTGGPYLWIGGAAILLLFILWLLARKQPGSFIAFKSTAGKIIITRSAINELAQRTCSQIETIGKCSTRIKTRGGTLKIEVRIQLLAGSKLNDVTSDLQTHLTHAFGEILGIENLGDINVVVTGFIGSHDATPPPAMSESLESEFPETVASASRDSDETS